MVINAAGFKCRVDCKAIGLSILLRVAKRYLLLELFTLFFC
jgi:hypothetical protein